MTVQNVTYQEPTIQRLKLGSKPPNAFNDNPEVTTPYVEADEIRISGAGATVWGDVPLKNPDGTPQLKTIEREIDVTPRSPLKYGLIAGGIGVAVGAIGGFAGVGTGFAALAGGLGLGGLAGGVAALAVKGDKVKIVWDTHQIKDHKLLGYHEYVGIGESGGKRGYFHRFVPDVQETVIGTYQTPRTEHYKEAAKPNSSGPEAPKQ